MRPAVRLFVACWNGTPGTAVEKFTLADIKTIVRPKSGEQYPVEHPEFCFFAYLTGGRGVHTFAIQQQYGVGPDEKLVAASRPVTVDLGSDPLAVRGLAVYWREVPFARPGQYEFVLVCDGMELEPTVYIEARA